MYHSKTFSVSVLTPFYPYSMFNIVIDIARSMIGYLMVGGNAMTENPNDDLVKYLKALVILQLHALNKDEEAPKPEVLLARAGLNSREIAEMVGKNATAVAKVLQRAKVAA